ncbi:amidohydrolase family protein [Nitrososphaera sp. AFS]|uniref:amidohydrolase family protein n=1 Tax=Nitrososphaera sp. AFS TaxID=2301191 RepID=UPI0013923216|nr:amidohydrolase family protein [Nitrososphaera sp. AFS]NAL76992.1 cytosine deaminase [Nitrososphaera sp. AFS]
MSIIFKNASLLVGKELFYVPRGYLEVGHEGIIKEAKHGIYQSAGRKVDRRTVFDAEGFLLIPGMINAHTHIGDSIGKDIDVDSGLDERVHPIFGTKQRILQSKPDHLRIFIRSSALRMIKNGITAFGDFREGGLEGIKLLNDAISDLPIKYRIFGRIEHYTSMSSPKRSPKGLSINELQTTSAVLGISNGLGLSGANENSNEALCQYRKLITAKNSNMSKVRDRNTKLLVAVHAAESKKTADFSKIHTSQTEVSRIMKYLKPDILVHMTNATEKDISIASKNQTGIIVCPRANGVLGAGIPPVAKMLDHGCLVGIGSDNVMLNSPDILRELDYIWKASRSVEKRFLKPKETLKMATTNNAKILRLNSGYLDSGRDADILFVDKSHLDLYPMHDPIASIIHRLTSDSIKAVMIDGKFVDGALL